MKYINFNYQYTNQVNNFIKSYDASPFLMTLVFNKYNDYYHPLGVNREVDRQDFKYFGVNKMPKQDAIYAKKSAIDDFYIMLLKKIFGRRYYNFRDYQPLGIGYFDKPSHKPYSPTANHLQAHVEYPHAHILMCVPKKVSEVEILDIFEELIENGTLSSLWYQASGGGSFHIEPCEKAMEDYSRVLQYISKTAYREEHGSDMQIFLPCGGHYSIDYNKKNAV